MALSFLNIVDFQIVIHTFHLCSIVPSRNTVRRCILAQKEETRVQEYFIVHECNLEVSVTADVWSSCVFKEHFAVTGRCICKEWKMRSTIIDIASVQTPHTSGTVC